MNILGNGTVLPFGLLSEEQKSTMAAFAKTHQNFAMRVGVVTNTYPVGHENNKSKLCTEYDVVAFEQQEDRGTTTITYRNCLSADGLGSIADFFERALRSMKKKKSKGDALDMKGQDGAVVLVMCLDGMSERGIILGAFTHPDRDTTLKDEGPHLEGEYNGVNVKVEKDGSCTLTFKGATGNDGKVLDSSQGNTTVKIEKDGSYQVDHKTITQRFDKGGDASLTADGNISNTAKKNYSVNATENIQLTATKDLVAAMDKLTVTANGSAAIKFQTGNIEAQSALTIKGATISVEADGLAKIKASQLVLDGLVSLGGDGGQPILLLTTQFIGVGNLGIPVLSQAIAGYATKVMGQ